MTDILTDEDVGIKPRVDLSPLQSAMESMVDDLHEKNVDALTSAVTDSIERVEEIAESIQEGQTATLEALRSAVTESSKAGADTVAAALAKIKMPDLGAFGKAVAEAIGSQERAMTKALGRVAESNDRIASALAKIADMEAREINLDVKTEKREAPNYRFDISRNDNGEITVIDATVAGKAMPKSPLEAAKAALEK